MQTNRLQRIAITMGEAAGVGPELIVKIAQLNFPVQLVVLADADHLKKIAQTINLPLKLTPISWNSATKAHQAGHLWIENIPLHKDVCVGKLDAANAQTTLQILNRASELALNKMIDAVVTAPVHKANLNQVDNTFLGHTEFFAHKAKAQQVVMMLATKGLRVILATTHIPLARVAAAITQQHLIAVLQTALNDLQKYYQPVKIAVCGLNPHAGENGLLGDEEQKIILPVIDFFQQNNQQVAGPFPADTLFTEDKRAKYDVFLAMYHDQGLPVIKALGFGRCANITLGLPYIRTSVDHGTALDIAASYSASADSLEYAIHYAIQMAHGRLVD